jgi:predicted RNA polymerase sigma factor
LIELARGHLLAAKADWAEAHYNQARMLHRLGELEAALLSFDRALQLAPGQAARQHNRAGVLHAAINMHWRCKRMNRPKR